MPVCSVTGGFQKGCIPCRPAFLAMYVSLSIITTPETIDAWMHRGLDGSFHDVGTSSVEGEGLPKHVLHTHIGDVTAPNTLSTGCVIATRRSRGSSFDVLYIPRRNTQSPYLRKDRRRCHF